MTQALTTENDVESLIVSTTAAWLFKHSITCSISSAAHQEFLSYLSEHADEPAGVLVVQNQRPLSNWVATRLKYSHQSPQLFLLQGGKVVWSASHWSITAAAMNAARKKAT